MVQLGLIAGLERDGLWVYEARAPRAWEFTPRLCRASWRKKTVFVTSMLLRKQLQQHDDKLGPTK